MTNREYVEMLASRGVRPVELALGINPDDVVRQFQAVRLAQREPGDGRLWIESRVSTPAKNEYGIVVKPESFVGAMSKWREFPVMLAYHDMNRPVGRWPEDELSDDGLILRGFVSSAAPDIQQLVRDEVLTATSISFWPKKEEWDEESKTLTILEMELLEVSLVPIPADRGTWVRELSGMGFGARVKKYHVSSQEAAIVVPTVERAVVQSMKEDAAASFLLAAIDVLDAYDTVERRGGKCNG